MSHFPLSFLNNVLTQSQNIQVVSWGPVSSDNYSFSPGPKRQQTVPSKGIIQEGFVTKVFYKHVDGIQGTREPWEP